MGQAVYSLILFIVLSNVGFYLCYGEKAICFKRMKRRYFSCRHILSKSKPITPNAIGPIDGVDPDMMDPLANHCCLNRAAKGYALRLIQIKTKKRSFECKPCSEIRRQRRRKKEGWSQWGPWSDCSKTCEAGFRQRRRYCLRTTWSSCPGHGTQSAPCMLKQNCPVNGQWGEWLGWETCSKSCSLGIQARRRICDSPAPKYGGLDCPGQQSGSKPCNLRPCPIDGQWSNWGSWSTCTVTCGKGEQRKQRQCNNPSPAYGGKGCSGKSSKRRPCHLTPCPIDGGWSLWSSWSQCSTTCGPGLLSRTRGCNAPKPKFGGKPCEGNTTEERYCEIRPCPSTCGVNILVHGGWSPWSAWSVCVFSDPSQICGPGIESRDRNCSNPRPEFGGKRCSGEPLQRRVCEKECRDVDGAFCPFGSWSLCSTCNNTENSTRSRNCSCPPPKGNGSVCVGPYNETTLCNETFCGTQLTTTTEPVTFNQSDSVLIIDKDIENKLTTPMPEACYPLNLTHCNNVLPWRQTTRPRATQQRYKQSFSWVPQDSRHGFTRLFTSECHPDVRLLFCAHLVPQCPQNTTVKTVIQSKPCRSFCDDVMRNCSSYVPTKFYPGMIPVCPLYPTASCFMPDDMDSLSGSGSGSGSGDDDNESDDDKVATNSGSGSGV